MRLLRYANLTVPAGNQVTNTVTKTLTTTVYSYPVNNYSGQSAGNVFSICAFGYISSAAATPGTLAFNIEIGGTILGTATFTLPTSLANAGFKLDATVKICTTGTSGLMSCQGMLVVDGSLPVGMVNTGLAAAGQKTVNTQANGSLGVSVQFSFASASNIVTLTDIVITEDN